MISAVAGRFVSAVERRFAVLPGNAMTNPIWPIRIVVALLNQGA